ncbi:MAG TPA: flagellar motor switch protein FliM [Acidimicrobiales bacterium]|nr:flagellar motor switch protein FliM [Acidimicrobiales bacterium]
MSAATATAAPLAPELVRARRRRGAPRPRPEARSFDPNRPGMLPSAHRRALVLVFEAFCRSLTSTLAGQLRTPTTVSLRGVDHTDYAALVAAAGDPTWIAALALGPLEGAGVLEVPVPLAMRIAERLLGGGGAGPQPERALTDLEQRLVWRLLDMSLHELESAMAPLCDVRPQVVRVEQQAELLKAAAPAEAFAVITLGIELPESGSPEEQLSLALPLDGLAPAFDAFAGSTQAANVVDPEPANVGDHLLDAAVEVALRFGPMTLRAGDVLALREGQLLPFRHRTASPLSLDVEGVPFLTAKAGRIGRRLACVVVDRATATDGQVGGPFGGPFGGAQL